MGMKKIISLVLVITIILTDLSLSNAYADTKFSDVKSDDWYYKALVEAVDKGIINGYTDGTFRPNSPLKFEEFVKMVMVAVHTEEEIAWATYNKDFSKSVWYEKFINAASNYNSVNAFEAVKLTGTDITRGKMAEIIYNVLSITRDEYGYSKPIEGWTDLKSDELIYIRSKFSDLKINSEYSTDMPIENKILNVAKQGIINGYTDKTFKADKCLTRAEALTVVLRLIDESKRTPITIDFNTVELENLIAIPELEYVDNERDILLFSVYLKNYENYSNNVQMKIEYPNNSELYKQEVKYTPMGNYSTYDFSGWFSINGGSNDICLFTIKTETCIAKDYVDAKEKLEKLKAGYELKIVITIKDTINGVEVEKSFEFDKVLTFKGVTNVKIVR